MRSYTIHWKKYTVITIIPYIRIIIIILPLKKKKVKYRKIVTNAGVFLGEENLLQNKKTFVLNLKCDTGVRSREYILGVQSYINFKTKSAFHENSLSPVTQTHPSSLWFPPTTSALKPSLLSACVHSTRVPRSHVFLIEIDATASPRDDGWLADEQQRFEGLKRPCKLFF